MKSPKVLTRIPIKFYLPFYALLINSINPIQRSNHYEGHNYDKNFQFFYLKNRGKWLADVGVNLNTAFVELWGSRN